MIKRNRGFTLLEIIAVISLLVVIASISIPTYTKIVGNQKLKTDLALALQLEQHAKTYYIEKQNTDTVELEKYIIEIYEEMPKSKYYNEPFKVVINSSSKKVTVSSKGNNFIENGEAKELKAD